MMIELIKQIKSTRQLFWLMDEHAAHFGIRLEEPTTWVETARAIEQTNPRLSQWLYAAATQYYVIESER